MRKLLPLLTAYLTTITVALGAVLTAASPPAPMQAGATPTAAQWNAQIVDIHTWVNANVVAALNVLTAKGDLYVYNGSSLARHAVGSNTQMLQAQSAQANGIAWATYTGEAPMTTKGDLITFDGSACVRLPVGSNNQVLGADSSTSTGLKWLDLTALSEFPTGTIIAWSPTGAGTTTIPTGWSVCDGTSGTPNLIGLFIIGTRPNGSSASPASGGYGAQTVDGRGAGVASHSHTCTWNAGAVGVAGAGITVDSSTGALTIPSFGHGHTFSSSPTASGSTTVEPSDFALIYLMKQ